MSTCAGCGGPWHEDQLVCPSCGGLDAVGPVPDPEPSAAEARPSPVAVILVAGGQAVALDPTRDCLLGRDDESPLAEFFRRYPNVSGVHASIRVSGGSLVLVDHSSRNGTWTGDGRLESGREHPLTLPVRLRLASNCFLEVTVAGPSNNEQLR